MADALMPRYEDKLQSPYSSSDDVEMQERDAEGFESQSDRLLPATDDGPEIHDEVEYREEWHLRTGWVIVGTILILIGVCMALITFVKIFIVHDIAVKSEVQFCPESFRRPASDYILSSTWDLDAPKAIREYNWTIVDIVGNPDGVYRQLLTINGQFPGPLIECNEGDTLVIEVENLSVNATSIHFHGILQNGTNWMDGTTGITQCPIAPNHKFRYEFTINGQSGTYYYHGHQAVQASDGLYGPLVVHARDEKRIKQSSYTSDRVVMLQDYYHDLSSALLVSNLEPGSEGYPIPDGALINGLNQRDCSKLTSRLCDNSTTSLSIFDLIEKSNHRLRFINVGAAAWFQVSLDDHSFEIIEIEGTDILPAVESRLMIGPSQRYSMVVNTNNTAAESFWLRAKMVTHCWKEPSLPGPGADEVKAIIQYTSGENDRSHATDTKPTSNNSGQAMEVECRDMNTETYKPARFEPAPAVADHSYYFRLNLEIGDWRLERGFFNQSTFRPNLQHPTLHRTVEGLSGGNETFISMSEMDGVNSVSYDLKNDLVIQHSGIKVVDVIIQNFDEGDHPMHLHGHKYWVLGQGHGMFPGYSSLGLQPEGRGALAGNEGVLDTLMRRDVASAEGFGWIALRFIANNPGIWAFHCHMAWHSEAGMLLQFASRIDEMVAWSVPEANRRLCEADISELEKGATPKDSIWFGFGVGG